MQRTVGCNDLGVDCDFRVTAEEGQDEFILDQIEAHAHSVHPDVVDTIPHLRDEVRKYLKSLSDQSHYASEINQSEVS